MTKTLRTALTLLLISTAATACKGKGGSDIGVAECDQYIAKVQACGKKVGGQIGESLERGAKMFADAWKDNAKDDSMKEQLPKSCSDATAAAKKQFTQCEW
jgi:hypothetical protein